jgi:hypothetical protein
MLDFITVPLVVGIVTLGMYGLFELFARRKERLMLIEKYGINPGPSIIPGQLTLPSYQGKGFGTLKLACLLLGVGLGLLVGFFIQLIWMNQIIPHAFQGSLVHETTGIIYGASVLLFGGLGLLIAFFIEQKYVTSAEDKK